MIAEAADQRMILVRSFQTGPRGSYTQQLLNELTAAKLCLLDPNTKTTYDAVLEGQLAANIDKDPNSLEAPPIADPRRAKSHSTDVTPPPLPSEQTQPQEKSAVRRKSSWFSIRSWVPIVAVASVIVIAIVVWAVGTSFAKQKKKIDVVLTSKARLNSLKNQDNKLDKSDGGLTDDEGITIVQEGDGSFNFPASIATIHGKNARLDNHDGNGLITNWSTKDDWLSWRFNVVKGGIFRVQVTYLIEKSSSGGRFFIAVGDQEKSLDVQVSESPSQFVTDEFYLLVKNRGTNHVEMRALEIAGGKLLTLKDIRFSPKQ